MNKRTLQSLVLGASLGIAAGIGVFTFGYAQGASYLTNNPASCANCHVMNEQYEGWTKSSHHNVATCNDCHTPPGTIAKYATKANNGFWHSFAFTTGWFHEPIQIGARNRQITEQSCQKCHADLTQSIHAAPAGQATSCLHCHRSVGHMH